VSSIFWTEIHFFNLAKDKPKQKKIENLHGRMLQALCKHQSFISKPFFHLIPSQKLFYTTWAIDRQQEDQVLVKF